MQPMFNGSRWLPAQDGRSIAVVSPDDGEAFEQIPCGGAHEVALAVAAARAALDRLLAATERGRSLDMIGEAVLAHEEDRAQLAARATGKPMATARNDIKVQARYIKF